MGRVRTDGHRNVVRGKVLVLRQFFFSLTKCGILFLGRSAESFYFPVGGFIS